MGNFLRYSAVVLVIFNLFLAKRLTIHQLNRKYVDPSHHYFLIFIIFNFFFCFSTADSLKIVGLWGSLLAIEEKAMNDNNDSLNNINILGNHILQNKSQNQEFFHRIKTDKVVPQTKRKLSQDLSSAKKICVKEEPLYDETNLHSLHALVKEEIITEPENVHLIHATTINPNDILDTNSAPQVGEPVHSVFSTGVKSVADPGHYFGKGNSNTF